MAKVADPWLEQEPDPAKRAAVVTALMEATHRYDELLAEVALPGKHPLARRIVVHDAGVVIDVILGHPFRAIMLKAIHL